MLLPFVHFNLPKINILCKTAPPVLQFSSTLVICSGSLNMVGDCEGSCSFKFPCFCSVQMVLEEGCFQPGSWHTHAWWRHTFTSIIFIMDIVRNFDQKVQGSVLYSETRSSNGVYGHDLKLDINRFPSASKMLSQLQRKILSS